MDNLSELKAMPIWVCWNKIEKNGRMTKVPCSAHGGKTGTNEEYRGTWVRYDEAIAAAQKFMYPASTPTPSIRRAGRDCICTENATLQVYPQKPLTESANSITGTIPKIPATTWSFTLAASRTALPCLRETPSRTDPVPTAPRRSC